MKKKIKLAPLTIRRLNEIQTIIEGWQDKVRTILETVLLEKGIVGNYGLSPDLTTLILQEKKEDA